MARNNKQIVDRITKSRKARWQDFEFIQPEDLKSISDSDYQLLKNSLIDNDLIYTFHVWENEGRLICLDGYHRCLVLRELAEEGYQVSDRYTANFVDCKDEADAIKKVLIYTSQYAKTNKEAVKRIIGEYGLDTDELQLQVSIPYIDIEDIVLELEDPGDGEGDGDDGEGGGSENLSPVYSYSIIFDTEDQLKKWHEFLGALKGSYPNRNTVAARIIEHITSRNFA